MFCNSPSVLSAMNYPSHRVLQTWRSLFMENFKSETNRGIKKSNEYHSHIQRSYIDFAKGKGCGTKYQACHGHFHFEAKIVGIHSVLQLQKWFKKQKVIKVENNLGHFNKFCPYLERFWKYSIKRDFYQKCQASLGQSCPFES